MQSLPDAVVDPFAPQPTPARLAPVATTVPTASPDSVPAPSAAYGTVSALQPFNPFEGGGQPSDAIPGLISHAAATGPYGPSPVAPAAAPPPLNTPPFYWGQHNAGPAAMHMPGLQNEAGPHANTMDTHIPPPPQLVPQAGHPPPGGMFSAPPGGSPGAPGGSGSAGPLSFSAAGAHNFPAHDIGTSAVPMPSDSGAAAPVHSAGAQAPAPLAPTLPEPSAAPATPQDELQQQRTGAATNSAAAAPTPPAANSVVEPAAPQPQPPAAGPLPAASKPGPQPVSPTARAPLRADLFASPQVAAQVSAHHHGMPHGGFGMPPTGQGYPGMHVHPQGGYAAAATGFAPQNPYFSGPPHMPQQNGAVYMGGNQQQHAWAPQQQQQYGAAPTGYMQPHMMHGQHAPMPGHPGISHHQQQWGQQPNMHMAWPHASQAGGQQGAQQAQHMGCLLYTSDAADE